MLDFNSTPFPKFQPVNTIGRRFRNHTGKRYGRLLVLGLAGNAHGRTQWFCLCDCGTLTWTASQHLTRGTSKSCGCFHRDSTGKRAFRHGLIHTPEWNSWNNMQERCYRPTNVSYSNYGGRGITVYDGWRGEGGFLRFLAYIGLKPTLKHSIDRINVDGNYEPGNVRWADRTEQMHNKRTTRLLTFQDKTQSMSEWARECGLTFGGLKWRIDDKGMTVEEALSKPNRNLNR